jgi:hypothetical protein
MLALQDVFKEIMIVSQYISLYISLKTCLRYKYHYVLIV